LALVDLSVVEQRYRAVLAVERGEPKIVVATQFGRKVTNVLDCGRQVRWSPPDRHVGLQPAGGDAGSPSARDAVWLPPAKPSAPRPTMAALRAQRHDGVYDHRNYLIKTAAPH
jgi:hypothetical protein